MVDPEDRAMWAESWSLQSVRETLSKRRRVDAVKTVKRVISFMCAQVLTQYQLTANSVLTHPNSDTNSVLAQY